MYVSHSSSHSFLFSHPVDSRLLEYHLLQLEHDVPTYWTYKETTHYAVGWCE